MREAVIQPFVGYVFQKPYHLILSDMRRAVRPPYLKSALPAHLYRYRAFM